MTKTLKSDKILKDKGSEIASNPKYDGYERGLPSMFYKFFHKTLVVLNPFQIKNFQMNLINQLLENFKEEYLKTIVGELILMICN